MPGAFTRTGFHKLFKSAGPAVTPVIHAQDETQVCRNIDVALRAGAAGVFLINHDFPPDELLPIVRAVRTRYPYLWLGLNFLAVTGLDAFPVLAKLAGEDVIVDAYWADDARVDERVDEQTEANAIARLHAGGGWHGLYFGGVAFKKQRPVEPALYTHSAGLGAELMDVVTTSGIATGEA
ncbi:MAG: adenine phosphoribosyltransferase, partial [Pseudomonadota bacterium]